MWTALLLIGAAAVAYGLTKVTHAGKNIVTETKGRIHTMNFDKIVMAFDTAIKNPSTTELTIQYPFVKVFYKEVLVASSELKNTLVTIQPLMQTDINDLRVPISFLKLSGVATELIQKIQDKNKKVTFQVEVSTIVHLAGSKIPYSKTEDITV